MQHGPPEQHGWFQLTNKTPGNHITLGCNKGIDIDSDLGCYRAMGPDMALDSSSSFYAIMVSSGKQALKISLLCTTFTSSILPLSTDCEPF